MTGSYTNSNSVNVIVTGNLTGAGSLTQGANSTLEIGGTSTITTLTATAIPNLVLYNGATAQTIKATTYYNLTITSGNTATAGATFTCNNNLSLTSGTFASGAFTINVLGATSVSGGTLSTSNAAGVFNLQSLSLTGGTVAGSATGNVKVGTTLSIPSGSPTIGQCNLTVTGATTIDGSLTFNNITGAKIFGDVTVDIGGTWNSAVVLAFKINGNLSNSGTFTAGTGVYTLAGAAKTISGTLTINSIAVTGTYTNNASLTCSTALTGAGTFSQGATGTLNIGTTTANFSVTTFNASTSGNTVNYNFAGAQNVRTPADGAYHHLTLGGSGTKTLLAATTVNGNLTISSTLDVTAGNFAINLKGNWSNSGTFTEQSGTVNFNGTSAQTIGGATTTTFYNMSQSNAAGVSLTSSQNLTNVLTISAGTFTTTGFNFTLQSTVSGTASVAAIPGGANFAGNLIIQRYTGNGPTDWRFFSSAVTGATIADWADDFTTSGFTGATCNPTNCGSAGCSATCNWPSIYSYNEPTVGVLDSGYVAATNITNNVSNGLGYWVYLGPNPITYSVTGPPNTFSQSAPVTFTANAGAANDGWNLIANPYPSAIDWSNANWTKANMDDAVYVYNSSTGSTASYISGVGVNGGSRYIASQQAFWVKANAAAPVLTMVENVKSPQNPTYLRHSHVQNTSQYPMAFQDFPVELNANTFPNSIKLTANGNGFDDETFIRFEQGASANFDGAFDAWKMQNLNPLVPTLSSVINDSLDLSINTFPELTSGITIPIRMRVDSSGTYSIRRDSMLMLPMSSCIQLEDLATGNMIDLRSAISYSFTISDTTNTPRFLLHISTPISKKAQNTICPNDSSGAAIAKGTGTGPWNYVWKNPGGTILKTTTNSSTADTLFHIPVGIYSVEVSGSVCGIVTDTIHVNTSSTLELMVNYSNVTCNGLKNGSAYTTISGGNPPYNYVWNNGATTSAINNLSTGNYSVTVTDAGGCSQIQTIIISQPNILIAGFTISSDTVNLSVNSSVSFTNTSSGAITYNWNFGDLSSADTSQDPIHDYPYAGTYTVMLVVSNGTCWDTSYAHILVLDSVLTTGIHNLTSSSSIKVIYDNGEVFLAFDLPEVQDVSISVYSALGAKLFVQNVEGVQRNLIKLDMNDFAAGIYISVADMSNAILAKKIVIPSR